MMNNWISVKDRLPEEQGEYLVCLVDEDNTLSSSTAVYGTIYSFWHEERKKCHWYYYYQEDIIDLDDDVVYWMPLPEPPTIKKEKK